MHKLFLFSTSDTKSGRSDNLDRMIASVEAFRRAAPDVDVRLYLLLQRCAADRAGEMIAGLPAFVEAEAIDRQIPLSVARNRLLARMAGDPRMDASSIVAFPDDDCWYPDGALQAVRAAFGGDRQLDFWFCRYSSQPIAAGAKGVEAPSLQNVISRASSNTIFLRGTVAAGLATFDEGLGVGTAMGGGEDTEYAIRAFYAARKTLFVDAAMIGHRDPDPRLKPKYFAGSLVAIARHAGKSPAGAIATARKLGVGLSLVAMRKMTLGSLIRAARAIL